MAAYANLAKMYVGDNMSPDFYVWVFPKCDHVAVGTGTVAAKPAILSLQGAARAQATPKLAGGVVVCVEAHPIPSGGVVGPVGADDDVDSEQGGDQTGTGAGGAKEDVVEEVQCWFRGLLGISSPNLHIFCAILGENGAILGEICIISPPSSLPSSPSLRMPVSHLGRLDYDQSGTLGVRMALTVVAKNDNRTATAGFSDFHRIDVMLCRRSGGARCGGTQRRRRRSSGARCGRTQRQRGTPCLRPVEGLVSRQPEAERGSEGCVPESRAKLKQPQHLQRGAAGEFEEGLLLLSVSVSILRTRGVAPTPSPQGGGSYLTPRRSTTPRGSLPPPPLLLLLLLLRPRLLRRRWPTTAAEAAAEGGGGGVSELQGAGGERGSEVRAGAGPAPVRARRAPPALLPEGVQGVHAAVAVPAGAAPRARRGGAAAVGDRRDRVADRAAVLRAVHAHQRGAVPPRAYVFYEAILNRGYFDAAARGETPSPRQRPDLGLRYKELRFHARFLIVAMLLNRAEAVRHLAERFRALLEESKAAYPETNFKEWKQVLQEITRFLKADRAFTNSRPLRYNVLFDSHPSSLPYIARLHSRRVLRLQDALLTSYRRNEVKFTELTLDTFRMLQCLEWEPSGSFCQTPTKETAENGGFTDESGASGLIDINLAAADMTDPNLPSNPRKAIIYHPSISHLIAVIATICEELSSDGVLLIYISASGKADHSLGGKPNTNVSSESYLYLGSRGNGGLNNLYPEDLIPFTRSPLFLIIDSDNSQAFKAIHGAEKGETAALLLSPGRTITSTADCANNGSQFTYFLTAPLQAFCQLVGFSSDIEANVYSSAETILSSALAEWEVVLCTSDDLDLVWDKFYRSISETPNS
uniref:Protein SCAI n=1 Tax=Ananas comosus var. bracteatus TaxID=296719 RepID=A0A6V7P649_ANACO|nr:unnamed protein product [Ananas comosus var. bracteatus]